MSQVVYQDTVVEVSAPDSVLDALEKADFKIPFSCRSGLCHSCMMQAEEAPPVASQQGLSDNQIAQDFFLACSCFPQQDMQVNLIGDTSRFQVLVHDKRMLNDLVLCLTLQADCRWFPGQYVNVWVRPAWALTNEVKVLCRKITV